MKTTPIYVASVLLEKNRWGSKVPSFKVSDWSQRLADSGFDGIELWENHVLLAGTAEREALAASPLPVAVLNTYCGFDDESGAGRAASAELARYIDVSAVKFNFGADPTLEQTYIANLSAWCGELPTNCRLLCECHRQTILEEPERAASILKPLQGRVEIIVHAFAGDDDRALQQWLDAFGPAVTHIHAVIKERGHVTQRVALLKAAGFAGTCSVEFCRGVDEPPEDMEQLLATATEDLNYLRERLA